MWYVPDVLPQPQTYIPVRLCGSVHYRYAEKLLYNLHYYSPSVSCSMNHNRFRRKKLTKNHKRLVLFPSKSQSEMVASNHPRRQYMAWTEPSCACAGSNLHDDH
jgi:hypothetical protein